MMTKMKRLVMYEGCSVEQTRWGGNDDTSLHLTVGLIYEIHMIYVHTWHTKVSLIGFPGLVFNSVCFSPVSGIGKREEEYFATTPVGDTPVPRYSERAAESEQPVTESDNKGRREGFLHKLARLWASCFH